MNKAAWIGIILWGVFVAGFGLFSVAPPNPDSFGSPIQVQDVVFLLAGGLVTCLIGVVGLAGYMAAHPSSYFSVEPAGNGRAVA